MKQRYFFTYGLDNEEYPFSGGWTEVIADSETDARHIFKATHPNENGELLRCAWVYDEEAMRATKMFKNGNYGAFCHERITVEVVHTDPSTNDDNIMVCPVCGNLFDDRYPAISRRDNKTHICSACGTAEALEDFVNAKKKGDM